MKIKIISKKNYPELKKFYSEFSVSEDARIGIKALEILGRNNRWSDEDVRNALKQAYIEVEGETLRNLGYRDLLILSSLIRNYIYFSFICNIF